MNITTTYKTNHNGTGQIVAKSGGRQRTMTYVHSLSADQNHGCAAAVMVNLFGDPVAAAESIDSGKATHTATDDGKTHKFRL